MNPKINQSGFDARRHLPVLKTFLLTANLVVLFIYGYMLLAFYDLPSVPMEELPVVGNLMAWATLFAVSLSFILFTCDGLAYIYRNRKQVKFTSGIRVSEVSGG